MTVTSGAAKLTKVRGIAPPLSISVMLPWKELSAFFSTVKTMRGLLELGSASLPCQVPAMD